MGRARINSHLGGGLYDAVYWRDVEAAKKRLDELDKRRGEIELELYQPGGAADKKAEASNRVSYYVSLTSEAIDDWAECARINCGSESSLKSKAAELLRKKTAAAIEYSTWATAVAMLKAEELDVIREIGRLQSTATDSEFESMQIWAVDYPHDDFGPIPAGTVVGTTESYGAKGTEIGNADLELPAPHINILPSYENEAAYDEARDHVQRPLGAMTTAESIMNTLQFLYVANRSPSYCVGTLTSKDDQTDTATVTISGVTPASREPEGFEYQTLSSVPVVYQECNAKVFEPGDKVVVKFGGPDFASPTVIGFAENPKECKLLTLIYTTDTSYAYISGPTPQTVIKGTDGAEVQVVLTDPQAGLLNWSDGAPFVFVRKDLEVAQNITAHANIVTGITWPTKVAIQINEDINYYNGGWSSARHGAVSVSGGVKTYNYDGATSCNSSNPQVAIRVPQDSKLYGQFYWWQGAWSNGDAFGISGSGFSWGQYGYRADLWIAPPNNIDAPDYATGGPSYGYELRPNYGPESNWGFTYWESHVVLGWANCSGPAGYGPYPFATGYNIEKSMNTLEAFDYFNVNPMPERVTVVEKITGASRSYERSAITVQYAGALVEFTIE